MCIGECCAQIIANFIKIVEIQSKNGEFFQSCIEYCHWIVLINGNSLKCG